MVTALSDTLVVVPALNEEGSVAQVVAKIKASVPDVTVLVVDDGSTDETAARAASAGAVVASLPFNLGVGGAMRLGFRYAEEHGFKIVVQVDADGQHEPAELPTLVQALAHADVVIGARFAGAGSYRVRGPRKWAMSVLAWVISRSARTTLTDTTSGFRATGPRAITLFARHYPAEYLGDTVESLVIACRAGMRISQVPVQMNPRQAGEPSHNPVRAAIYLARAVLALAFALARPSSSYGIGAKA